MRQRGFKWQGHIRLPEALKTKSHNEREVRGGSPERLVSHDYIDFMDSSIRQTICNHLPLILFLSMPHRP